MRFTCVARRQNISRMKLSVSPGSTLSSASDAEPGAFVSAESALGAGAAGRSLGGSIWQGL